MTTDRVLLREWRKEKIKVASSRILSSEMKNTVQMYELLIPLVLHQAMVESSDAISRLDVCLGLLNYFNSNRAKLYKDAVTDAALGATDITIQGTTDSLDDWLARYFGFGTDTSADGFSEFIRMMRLTYLTLLKVLSSLILMETEESHAYLTNGLILYWPKFGRD
jgi:hypothetical protein